MDLEDLFVRGAPNEPQIDRRGGRTALDPDACTPAMRDEFRRLIDSLAPAPFWRAAADQNAYLPSGGLWAPQRRAVGLSLAHLATCRTSPERVGAALVKMPTGTGKTGVIATLACGVPEIRRTLIITPRRALVEQMRRDLHTRLWGRFGAIFDGAQVRPRRAGDAPIDEQVQDRPIHWLLPSQAKLLSELNDERITMVGTFAALEQVLRPDRPAHRLSGRRPAGEEDIATDAPSTDDPIDEAGRVKLVRLLSSFDLVIVDESHYEPAFVWSQCIRSLDRPTLLFSATPYRNDFRYFDIDGRFVFNLSFDEARQTRLVRDVWVMADDPHAVPGESFAERLVRFADRVGMSVMPEAPAEARIIVRAESHDSLVRLREELRRLGHASVLIHHKERRNTAKSLRFVDVTTALRARQAQGVRFWLHQWKLLEGVDDSKFCGVAVMESFSTSRAVVQQIGRVLRYRSRDVDEVALVIGDGAIGADLEDRFLRYLHYERQFDADPGDALKRETDFFEILRAASPAVQYISGDFRDRLDIDEQQMDIADIQLPMRTFVTRSNGALNLDQLAQASAIAMGLEDRHDPVVLSPTGDDPENVRLVAYVAWSNSPLLTRKAMPTWTLGVMVIVKVRSRVFLLDTEGLVVDPEALGLEPEGPEALQRLVPTSSSDEVWRVTVASAVSLDISDMGIRSMTARMRDFGEGFYDLAQAMQATTSVRALMSPPAGNADGGSTASRYLSLARATVSDARSTYATVEEYAKWIGALADRLDSTAEPSPAFARFAQALPAPDAGRAHPQNVLFDFADVIGQEGESPPTDWEPERTKALAHADRCLDVGSDGSFSIGVDQQTFVGKIVYKVTGTTRRTGKYVVELPELDAYLVGRSSDGVKQREKSQLLSGVLTRNQAFRVIPTDPGLVYAQKHFYRPAVAIDVVARDEPGGPLEAVIASPWLAHVTSEKGDGKSSVQDWVDGSLFGGIYAQCGFAGRGAADSSLEGTVRARDPAIADLLDGFSIVICDDGGTETCDFVCVDETGRRVVLIHAKVGDTAMSLNGLQEVGRQAQASLGLLTSVHAFPDRTARWKSDVNIEDGHLTRRLLRGPPVDAAWPRVRDALRSNSFTREIWIFAGCILSRRSLLKQLQRDPPTPKVRQMIYYLASLQTSAARANVGMRIFCSP